MGSASRITVLREQAKLEPAELAQTLGLTPAGYAELETDDEEIESSVSLTQALQLCRLLGTDLLTLLDDAEKPAPLPIARVRAGLQAELKVSPDIRESLEDEIDWNLGPFLEGLDAWGTVYTVRFIKALSTAMSLDWRAVLGGIENRVAPRLGIHGGVHFFSSLMFPSKSTRRRVCGVHTVWRRSPYWMDVDNFAGNNPPHAERISHQQIER